MKYSILKPQKLITVGQNKYKMQAVYLTFDITAGTDPVTRVHRLQKLQSRRNTITFFLNTWICTQKYKKETNKNSSKTNKNILLYFSSN